MPRKKPLSGEIRTQEDLWYRFFLLLNTTNYIADSSMRKRSALQKDAETNLQQSFIAETQSQTRNWVTRPIAIQKLSELTMRGCEVGKNGTSFGDVIGVVDNALSLHQAHHKALMKLSKTGSQVELMIMGVAGMEEAVASDIRCDPNMIAANGGTVQAGRDVIFVRWDIPLRKSVDNLV